MQKSKIEFSKVGAVIVTYNSGSYILNALDSLFKTNHPNLSVVVVDNGSKDSTVSRIRHKFKAVHIIENKKNDGYAKANNKGIRYLLLKKVEYILILNPDTIVSNNLFNELLKPMHENKNILAVGPLITYLKDPKKIWYAGGYFNKLFLYTKHPHMNKYLGIVKIYSGITDFITGACILVKKEAFEKIGFLPEEYFLYFEDVDFCKKINDKNYLCYFLAKPLVKHNVSSSSGIAGTNKISPLRAYYYARNPLLYIRKNGKGFSSLAWLFGQFFIRLPYYFLEMSRQRNPAVFLWYIRGIKDGVKGISGRLNI